MSTSNTKIDLDEADRFLKCLGRETNCFTFQTFDDDKERKDKKLLRVLHGTLAQHSAELARLNEEGAGVFVTVNETDGKGRTKANIVKVRAVFVDLDGAPAEPVMEYAIRPHMIVVTSPGRWHAYWLVDDLPLNNFVRVQRGLAKRFDGDRSVHDLPRVMRLPGFVHRKGEPFVTRIDRVHDAPPYKAADLPAEGGDKANPQDRGSDSEPKAAGGTKWRTLNTEALQKLSAWVPALFGKAAVPSASGGYRVSSKALGRDLQEDLSITPEGIVDFGVHDLGDAQEGKRSPIDLVMEHGRKDFDAAVAWLGDCLGAKEKAAARNQPLPLQWHGETLLQPTKWLIRDRLPQVGAGLLSGQWGTYKTFIALDASAHVMMGWHWTGEPVYRQAGVLYFAPEGGGSIAMRLAALVEHAIVPRVPEADFFSPPGGRHVDVDPRRLPFAWASTIPKLLGENKDDPLPLLLATAEEAHERFMKQYGLPLGLIWMDTMATATGWSDENDNAEASRAMDVLRVLSEKTQTAVVGVDHLGKKVEAGSRGASAKEANSDYVLALLADKDTAGNVSNSRLALRKMREGPAGLEVRFAPRVVDMGKDEMGFPVTSIVIDWNAKPNVTERKSNASQVLDEALSSMLAQHGKMVRLPDGSEVKAVARTHVMAAYKAAYKPDKPLSDAAKRQRFRDALKRAIANNYVGAGVIDGVECLWDTEIF
jgi:hypothetical protein